MDETKLNEMTPGDYWLRWGKSGGGWAHFFWKTSRRGSEGNPAAEQRIQQCWDWFPRNLAFCRQYRILPRVSIRDRVNELTHLFCDVGMFYWDENKVIWLPPTIRPEESAGLTSTKQKQQIVFMMAAAFPADSRSERAILTLFLSVCSSDRNHSLQDLWW